jgi:predicted PolB exonuclease-like 3'-5' exonuclease
MRVFVDIETVAGPTKPPLSGLEVPAKYKDVASAEAFLAEKQEELWRNQSLNSMQGEILTIGWAVEDCQAQALTVGLSVDNERELISLFEETLALERDFKAIEWVGHNALGFDCLWLKRKAIKYRLKWLPSWIKMDRFRGNIRDTMGMWSGGDYRNNVKLDDLCRFLGVKGKLEGINGAMVHDYWIAGRLAEIDTYCRADVEATRGVYNVLEGYTW